MHNIQTQLQNINRNIPATFLFSAAVIFIAGLLLFINGCSPTKPISIVDDQNQFISTNQIEYLKNIEAYLPMLPDSIINQYKHYDKKAFHKKYQQKITFIKHFIDSLNAIVGPYWSIDTISIDHTVENFGTAAYQGRTLYVSSSYFFVYAGTEVLRSIITHEFGHIYYARLIPYDTSLVHYTLLTLKKSALLYLFHDGEYSHNARFGGHPGDSSEELFASAYNLFTNQTEEFEVRLKYVDTFHLKLIGDFRVFVECATSDRHLMTK
jgi:hypothetical protein